MIYFFIGGVIRLGYIDFNLALLDRRKNGIYRLGSRMSDWWRVLCAKITLFFALSLGYVLLIAPGIITKYSYAMVPYILEERPDFTVHEAFKASKQIMKKHKWELFCLRFSFIGWYIIGILTLGIGLIFINPYRYADSLMCRIIAFFIKYAASKGIAVLIISGEYKEMLQVCDQIVELK